MAKVMAVGRAGQEEWMRVGRQVFPRSPVLRRILMVPAFLIVCLVPLGACPGAEAIPSVLTLHDRAPTFDLAPFISYYLDASRVKTVEDLAGEHALFRPLNASAVNLGLTKAVLWMRFQVSYSGENNNWLFDLGRPLEQIITLYHRDARGLWQSRQSCWDSPCPSGNSLARQSILPLPALTPEPITFYVRVDTVTALQFFPKICTHAGYLLESKTDFLWQGVYYGFCLAMILYNFSFFLFLRDKALLYYVLYVICLATYFSTLHGVALEYLTFVPVPVLLRLDLVFLALYGLCAAQFTRSFLLTGQNVPRADLLLKWYMWLSGLTAVLAPWVRLMYIVPLFNVMGAIGPFLSVIPAAICMRRGFRPARFYLVAYGLLTGGIMVFMLAYSGVIPLTPLIYHSFQIGSGLEILILAMALGYRIRALRQEKEALVESQKYYRETSMMDSLTGLYNRRYYEERMADEAGEAARLRRPLSLLMLDIDHFKKFNDTYGHPQGDLVLKELGDILKLCSRRNDIPCRYGGEEFVLILPNTGLSRASLVAERIREEFARRIFNLGEQGRAQATVSIGVAELTDGENERGLLNHADEALYRAKREGRNRVEKMG